jgi:uncharacterized protein YgiB involved in biofilm formation
MASSPLKTILIVAAVAAVGFSAFYALRGKNPACAQNGKYMSTIADCRAWGVAQETCAQVVEKARAVAARAAPKVDNQFQCELRFTECFENPTGGFSPRPSFCLREGAEPTEIRYLEFDSDRRNRRVTREVPIN